MNSGGNKGIRTQDGNLQRLVEEYLIQNCERTYIDMEDMIAVLQTKSYHFSRMKRQAFGNLVKNAYYSYCDENQIYYDGDKGNVSLSKAGPSQSQGTPDSDSDIEIEEPPKTIMSNQMTGLYQKPAAESIEYANLPAFKLGALRRRVPPASASRGENSNSLLNPSFHTQQANPKRRWNESSKAAESPGGNSTGSEPTTEVLPKGKDDDDLEIIEEFSSANRNQPQPQSSTTVYTRRVILGKDKTDEEQLKDAVRGGSKGLPDSVVGPPVYISITKPEEKDEVERNIAKLTRESSTSTTDAFTIDEWPTARGSIKPAKRSRMLDHFVTPTPSPLSKPVPKLNSIKNPKPKKEIPVVQDSNYTFSDFGGSERVLEEICKLLMHLKHPEMYRTLGVTPPRGFLLHGPPGCGKTLLANAIAGELKMPMLKMAATELISGISGESERNIRDMFDQALALAPCIIFIDEIDSITPKRETAQREMERRIVAQLLACIDDLLHKEKGDQVLLVGATNRIETIDTALRRAGRFDREICLGIPDEKAREKIFRVISRGLKLEPGFSFELLAKLTPGYVGADLQALVREAAVQAVTDILGAQKGEDQGGEVSRMDTAPASEAQVNNTPLNVSLPPQIDTTRAPEVQVQNTPSEPTPTPTVLDASSLAMDILPLPSPVKSHMWIKETSPLSQQELDNFCIHMKDFYRALKNVQPSSKREGFATVPDTTWEDIGALKEIRDELQVSILGPVKHSSAFQALGLNSPAGVLLCGPPGCGKTLLAKAVANEAGINFISVKGPELLNMYVGESERAVRQCFLRAKNSSPCVIFFDELDALCPRRSDGGDSGSSSRVVNQLLTEMDGMESRLGVFVMAATNRPDIIDPAILRPGRLDKILFVNLPTAADRVDILKAITKSGTKPILADDVKVEEIANYEKCENYTGADLASLVREAGIAAFRELILEPGIKNEVMCAESDLKVYQRHFDVAFTKTKPSVSKKDREKYDQMKERYSSLSNK